MPQVPAPFIPLPKSVGPFVSSVALAISLSLAVSGQAMAQGAPAGQPTPSGPGPGSDKLVPAGAPAATDLIFKVAGTDGEGLRLRHTPGLNGRILTRLEEGSELQVLDGAATQRDGERWLRVRFGVTQGWAAARYLTRTTAIKVEPRQLGPNATLGERVAALAEAAVGRAYTWGGVSPTTGFDCSGLVYWVYGQLGLKMPRTIAEQLEAYRAVEPAQLKAGDLVTFVDTYQPGLSHVGVYLGNSRFVHAADEAQGVTLSNILDEYWQPRFFRAARPGEAPQAGPLPPAGWGSAPLSPAPDAARPGAPK